MAERAEPAPAAAEPVSVPTAAPGAAPASMGAFTALGGPTSEDVVLRMQERVGNQATTKWLSRAVLARNVVAPGPGPTTEAEWQKLIDDKDLAGIKSASTYGSATPTQRIAMINLILTQGWVGPIDEYTLEAIWDTWGTTGIAQAYADNAALWDACVARGAELADIKSVAPLRTQFEADVKAVAKAFMRMNLAAVKAEGERLGLGALDATGQPATPNEAAVREVQELAREIQRADDVMAGLTQLQVGYDYEGVDLPGGVHKTEKVVATYNPAAPPMVRPGADDKGFAKYEAVDEQYKAVQKARATLASKNPALFALSGDQGEAGKVAKMKPEEAAARLRDVLGTTSKKIAETDPKIDSGDLDWRDLVPIHSQLYGGLPSASGTDWKAPLHKEVAKDVIGDHETTQFWIALGLGTLAAAAFIFSEIATGGMATFLWAAAGVAVSGTQAAMSIEKYEDLAAAAKTATSDDKQLVSGEQVTDALFAAIMDTAFAFLDAYQAVKGVATAIRATAARELIGKLGQLSGHEAAEAVQKAVTELGPQETMRRTGKTAEELVAIAGEQTDAATKLRAAASDAAVVPPAHDPNTGSGGVAPTAAGREIAKEAEKVFERWTTLTPMKRLEELLQTVNARLKEIGAPALEGVLLEGGTANGQLTFNQWELAVNGKLLRAEKVTEAEFAKLVNTVSHEGRHAEQWFKMAQVEAMTSGKNAADIAAKLGIPVEVAEAAIEVQAGVRSGVKLAGGAAEAEARRFFESVYGVGKDARNQTLKDLKRVGPEVEAATAEWNKVKNYPHDDPIRELADERLTKAIERRKEVRAAYKALPEEIDAFAFGDAAGASMAERFRALSALQAAERAEKVIAEELKPLEELLASVLGKPNIHMAYDKQLAYYQTIQRWKDALETIDRANANLSRLAP